MKGQSKHTRRTVHHSTELCRPSVRSTQPSKDGKNPSVSRRNDARRQQDLPSKWRESWKKLKSVRRQQDLQKNWRQSWKRLKNAQKVMDHADDVLRYPKCIVHHLVCLHGMTTVVPPQCASHARLFQPTARLSIVFNIYCRILTQVLPLIYRQDCPHLRRLHTS